jgi:hypothetical protein
MGSLFSFSKEGVCTPGSLSQYQSMPCFNDFVKNMSDIKLTAKKHFTHVGYIKKFLSISNLWYSICIINVSFMPKDKGRKEKKKPKQNKKK